MSILLLRYAKSRLLLNIDGVVKEFFDNDDKTMSKAFPDNLIYETEDVTNSFSSYWYRWLSNDDCSCKL